MTVTSSSTRQNKVLLVRCPHCRNSMKCQPSGSILSKRKRCVYCGKSFAVRPAIVQEI